MSTVVNVEKFYERLNRIHAHFVKHRYVDVAGGRDFDNYDEHGGSVTPIAPTGWPKRKQIELV